MCLVQLAGKVKIVSLYGITFSGGEAVHLISGRNCFWAR